jgi:hypothetical protein
LLAKLLLTIVAQGALPYCNPIYLARTGEEAHLGLHYIPAINKNRQAQIVTADGLTSD